MPITIDGFKEVLTILKELFSAVKAAAQLPEKNRKEMNEALADTAELIDETLTILKQHLTSVISELKFGDAQKAQRMISELGDFNGWEVKYRQFQLCDKLREAAFNLEKKGLYKLINKLSFGHPEIIQQRMWDYIGGETKAANSVGTMLQNLSTLDVKVPIDAPFVIKCLEEARSEVGNWRQVFIDLEKEIRT